MSKSRRRRASRRNPIPLILILLLLLTLVGCRMLLRAPEQKLEEDSETNAEISSGTDSNAELKKIHSHKERKKDFYTVLVSGTDNGNGGSDTNILVAIDAKEGAIYGVSIPRDTKACFNGKNHKINYAYNKGGMELLADVISDQLGIPVDYTIQVDLQGFVALVDAIHGVDFYVPVNMNYDDPYQDLSIHFSKGMQHLSGSEAMKVVRFRHNNDGTGYGSEDLGRMQTQQDFLKTVAKKTLTLSNLDQLDSFVKIVQSYVKTDLSLGNLAWLGKEAITIGSDNIEFSTLPGEWRSPYIYLDATATLELINEHLNPYVEDRVASDLNLPR